MRIVLDESREPTNPPRLGPAHVRNRNPVGPAYLVAELTIRGEKALDQKAPDASSERVERRIEVAELDERDEALSRGVDVVRKVPIAVVVGLTCRAEKLRRIDLPAVGDGAGRARLAGSAGVSVEGAKNETRVERVGPAMEGGFAVRPRAVRSLSRKHVSHEGFRLGDQLFAPGGDSRADQQPRAEDAGVVDGRTVERRVRKTCAGRIFGSVEPFEHEPACAQRGLEIAGIPQESERVEKRLGNERRGDDRRRVRREVEGSGPPRERIAPAGDVPAGRLCGTES